MSVSPSSGARSGKETRVAEEADHASYAGSQQLEKPAVMKPAQNSRIPSLQVGFPVTRHGECARLFQASRRVRLLPARILQRILQQGCYRICHPCIWRARWGRHHERRCRDIGCRMAPYVDTSICATRASHFLLIELSIHDLQLEHDPSCGEELNIRRREAERWTNWDQSSPFAVRRFAVRSP